MSEVNTNGATSGTAIMSARAKDAAAQLVPAGKRAGTAAVLGVRQGVQGAREWATPRVIVAVLSARQWAAPRLDSAADAVTESVAPKVSTMLRSAASQVRPPEPTPEKTGVRGLLDWRWLVGIGAALAAGGGGDAAALCHCHRGSQGSHRNAGRGRRAGRRIERCCPFGGQRAGNHAREVAWPAGAPGGGPAGTRSAGHAGRSRPRAPCTFVHKARIVDNPERNGPGCMRLPVTPCTCLWMQLWTTAAYRWSGGSVTAAAVR